MISINSYSKEGNLLIQSCLQNIKTLFANDPDQVVESLTIVTPHQVIDNLVCSNGLWANIYQAWRNIVFPVNDSLLNNWRQLYKYGREIIPELKIFKIRNNLDFSYFHLFNETESRAFSDLNDLLFLFRAWHHIKSNRNLFHGAGVVKNNRAYLFLGSSGAGKSTISILSAELGYETIHDDQVVALRPEDGMWYLSDFTLNKPKIYLEAVYFLVQDKKDRIIPLSRTQTATRLYNNCFETPAEKILVGLYLKSAFEVTAEIARAVPGYELHFTKSVAFWKLIDDEKAF